MIDASKGYMKDGPKNRLRAQDIHKIVDTFTKRAEIPKYSRMVSLAEIESNDFNLNLPRYIDTTETEDLQDIDGHLNGGIPERDIDALQEYWEICPGLRNTLFRELRPHYFELAVDKNAIKSTIQGHPEFQTFIQTMNDHFQSWKAKASQALKGLTQGIHPKEVISELSEGLLSHYLGKPLLNPYDIYQHLLDYWSETMQDDCYLIAADGWKAQPYRIIEKDKKGKGKDKGWACDLVPKDLIVSRYFSDLQQSIEDLTGELDTISAKMTELEEEHGGEEGVFSDLEKVNKGTVKSLLAELKNDPEAQEDLKVLKEWLELSEQEASVKKKIKGLEESLDKKAFEKYSTLSEDDIRSLVVDFKWLSALEIRIQGEVDRVSQSLTKRVKELTERYESTLLNLTNQVADLESKVTNHLKRMGFSWN